MNTVSMSWCKRFLHRHGFISRRKKNKRKVTPEAMEECLNRHIALQMQVTSRGRVIEPNHRANIDQVPFALDMQSAKTYIEAGDHHNLNNVDT